MATPEDALRARLAASERYGGRGVTVAPGLGRIVRALPADMGERSEGLTLDRIDPNGNYEPGDCRWVSPKAQANNQRRHHRAGQLALQVA